MEYKRISEFANVVTGGTPSTSKEEYWEGGTIPWLQSGCCQNCFVNEASSFITQLGYDNSVAKMMPKDTVMIALTGATAGKVGYLTFEACGNQSITGILPNKTVLSKFLYYYLQFKRPDILSDCVGGAQPHISQGYVKNILVPIYSIEEQKEIVGLLDNISGSISNLLREYSTLDELIKSRFIELFGDPKTNSLNLDIDKPENLCESISAGGDRPKEVSEIRTDEFCYPIFSNGEKDDGLYGWSKEYRVEKPAVTVSGRGTIGYTSYRKEGKFTPIVRLIVMIPNERINPIYLTYYMNLEREEGSGSGVQQLTVPMIKQKNIIVPDIKSQNDFAEFVKLIDKSKFNIQQNIKLMQELLDKKMDEYFGGNE